MWDFLRAGGPFMVLLVITSIIGITFIIERGLFLRRSRILPETISSAAENARRAEDLPHLREACLATPSALSRLLLVVVDHLHWPKAEIVDVLQTRARQEFLLLERGLVILEIIVGIAPLLGLVGTIHGLITLFGDLGRNAAADNSVLAKGIAIALNTTLGGLLIAIPCLIAWSYFSKKVESLAVELEGSCDGFLRHHARPSVGKGK